MLHEPIVERPVILELEGAQRMRDVFGGVLEGMRKVVHRVDAPGIPRVMMGLVQDAMTYIWASRRGLTEAELLDLLGAAGKPLPRSQWISMSQNARQLPTLCIQS